MSAVGRDRDWHGRVLPVDPELRFKDAIRWDVPSVHRPELGPCLIYTGACNGNGYGQFRYYGKNGYAHRYAWERHHGAIQDGLTVDHLCRVRRCVNVAHLELVTGGENSRRGGAVRKRQRTHCKKGLHEWNALDSGTPQCPECKREREGLRWLDSQRLSGN